MNHSTEDRMWLEWCEESTYLLRDRDDRSCRDDRDDRAIGTGTTQSLGLTVAGIDRFTDDLMSTTKENNRK